MAYWTEEPQTLVLIHSDGKVPFVGEHGIGSETQ